MIGPGSKSVSSDVWQLQGGSLNGLLHRMVRSHNSDCHKSVPTDALYLFVYRDFIFGNRYKDVLIGIGRASLNTSR